MLIEDIQRKLKKILALSASPNKAEALNAVAKASALMKKYSIRTIDVDEENNHMGVSAYRVDGYTEQHEPWESSLAAAIAEPFDAKAIIHRDGSSSKWCVMFISSESEGVIIVDLYKRLRRVVSKMAKQYTAKRRNNRKDLFNSYAYGMINTINDRLVNIYVDTEETRALVVVKENAIQSKIKEMFGDVKITDPAEAANKEAYLKGAADGETVGLDKSVSTIQRNELLHDKS